MVTRLQLGADGEALNPAAMTVSQEIGWHRAQIAWLRSLGQNGFASRAIEHHSEQIARLKGGEVP